MGRTSCGAMLGTSSDSPIGTGNNDETVVSRGSKEAAVSKDMSAKKPNVPSSGASTESADELAEEPSDERARAEPTPWP